MAPVRHWARRIEADLLPRIQSQIHPSTAAVVIRELCETPRRVVPVHNQWLTGSQIDLPSLVAEKARSTEYIISKARILALMLGENVTNTMWTATVLINLALHDILPTLVSR